jgi:hypothetical protein
MVIALVLVPVTATCVARQADDEVIVLPIRIHMLSSTTAPDLNSTLSDDELGDVLDEVNLVWEQAGIRWEIESVVREEAVQVEEYLAAFGSRKPGPETMRPVLLKICPQAQWLDRGWNVCVIRRFPFRAGGVFLQERGEVVWPELTRGQMYPNMLTHELGHSLCLRHSSETPNNLMQKKPPPREDGRPGPPDGYPTNASRLSLAQIATARKQAAKGTPRARDLTDCP